MNHNVDDPVCLWNYAGSCIGQCKFTHIISSLFISAHLSYPDAYNANTGVGDFKGSLIITFEPKSSVFPWDSTVNSKLVHVQHLTPSMALLFELLRNNKIPCSHDPKQVWTVSGLGYVKGSNSGLWMTFTFNRSKWKATPLVAVHTIIHFKSY